MSYRYKIALDNPVGHWDFASQTSNTNTDLTGLGNSASISTGTSFSTPPLVINSVSAAVFTSNSSSAQILNKYNVFNINDNNGVLGIEFWLSLNNSLEDNSYDNNQTTSGYFTNNQLNIIRAINKNTGSTIARIFYDYDSNSIKYSVPGNSDAYCYLPESKTTYHVFAGYKAGQLSVIVDNINGYGSFVTDYSLINSASTSSNVLFIFDGSSINTNNSSSPKYLINNVAFYNYLLSNFQIDSHIKWAKEVDSPESLAILNTNIEYIKFKDNIHYTWLKTLENNQMSDYQEIYNLASDVNGILSNPTDDFSFSNTSSLYFNSSSGAFWSGSTNYLYIANQKNKIRNSGTIYATVSSSVSSSNQYVFSVTNVNNYSTLYLQRNPRPSSSGYYLYYYDEINQVSTLLASITGTSFAASGVSNVGFSFNESNVYLYANTSSVVNEIDRSVIPAGLSFSDQSTIIIGGNIVNNSSSNSDNTMFYSNVGFYDNVISDYATMSSAYSTNKMYFAQLKSNLELDSYGYVIYRFDPGLQPFDVYGSYVNWEGPANIKSSISYDYGTTWNNLNKNSYTYKYNHNVPLSIIDLKFEINRNFSSSAKQRIALNNLTLGTYPSLAISSDAGLYSLTASTSGSYSTHSFIDEEMVISRPKNLGIVFNEDEYGYVPSYAIISSSSPNISGIDFWLKINNLHSERTASHMYLLTTASFALYQNAGPNHELEWKGDSTLTVLVNGVIVGNKTFSMKKNEYYHIGIIPTASIGGNILLNGGVQNTGSYNANATYGHISIWSNTPTTTDIQNRYNYFVSNVLQTASASDTTLFLRSNGYYDTASTFVIG